MHVQAFLRNYFNAEQALEALVEGYKIEVTRHPTDGLVILNYSIESPKNEVICNECRGLVLEEGTWNVVARSFTRFFNYGENLDETNKFNWQNFTCSAKEDGSLILLYNYKGDWRVNTRGSFGEGEVNSSGHTWKELFYKCANEYAARNLLPYNLTYVFELCSVYNKIVRAYSEPTLYLLGIFHKDTGHELEDDWLNFASTMLGVKLPEKYDFSDIVSIQKFLDTHEDKTFEGLVLRDDKYIRIKTKNPAYVILHHLRGNGDNLFSAKKIVPLILKGEAEEWCAIFPEIKPYKEKYELFINEEYYHLMQTWEQAKAIASQKDFALFILPRTRFSSILFEARKRGIHPKEVWLASADLIVKNLEK